MHGIVLMRVVLSTLIFSISTRSSWSSFPLRARKPFSLAVRGGGSAHSSSSIHNNQLNTLRRLIDSNGNVHEINIESFSQKIASLSFGLNLEFVDPNIVARKAMIGICDGASLYELHTLAAETAAYLGIEHPDYTKLAARLVVDHLHSVTNSSFIETMRLLTQDSSDGKPGFIDADMFQFWEKHASEIEQVMDYSLDFEFDFFGIKTLERSYLLKVEGEVVERPQHMFMRVALGIHGDDLAAAFETYRLMSAKHFIHASPTLFHAGARRPNLSSCFLLSMKSDSIGGIYDTLKQCAEISKAAGGIGLSASKIRAAGSVIRGTNGVSNGLVPMLRVFDATARYVDQGGGKRPGAFAVYLEPWHSDVFDFLDLRKNSGKIEQRARDLFLGLWIPDLFMERVVADENWSLMCPDECSGLDEVWGEEFKRLYECYEAEGKVKRVVKARALWHAILEAQIETGTPYMLYKDACNAKSNQQNLGTISCSNLCTEIIQYSNADEVAVCNLASLALPSFVKKERVDESKEKTRFDFDLLGQITKVVTKNLNRVIDRTAYPVPEAERSNQLHRPMGIGVVGLADVFHLLKFGFDSPEARSLNKEIFETIYYHALEASVEEACEKGGAYSSFERSPLSEGKFQFDLWGVDETSLSGRWDWTALRAKIMKHGVRNSLLLAPMPTASTAQVIGCNECIEPFTTNLYTRRVSAGDFIVVNPHLVRELEQLGLWTSKVKNMLVASGGSVAEMNFLSEDIKHRFRTVWEVKQRALIDMAADRGVFIDQSQSLNCFMEAPDFNKLSSMHLYSWRKGLKTGMYYLRTKPAANAIQFTLDKSAMDDNPDDVSE